MKTSLLFLFCLFLSFFSTAQFITTVAGNPYLSSGGDGGPATAAFVWGPTGLSKDKNGNLIIVERTGRKVRKVTPAGIITTIAGTGVVGYSGDGGPATNAQFTDPHDITLDTAGNIYIADPQVHVVRKISTSGIITTVAGTGLGGYSGDGFQATATNMSNPTGLAFDAAGNLYVANAAGYRILKIAPSGVVTSIAGDGTLGLSGDGGLATAAAIGMCVKLHIDRRGNLLLTDYFLHVIRMISTYGYIGTIIGGNGYGHTGDGGLAHAAKIAYPGDACPDQFGNIFVADGNTVRKVDTSGIITRYSGDYIGGYLGNNGLAINARLGHISAIFIDGDGSMYLADEGDGCIWCIKNFRPSFINNGQNYINTCEGTGSIILDTMLSVTDTNALQRLTWHVLQSPAHGILAGSYNVPTNAGVVMPTGITYTPAAGYVGTDTFKYFVEDTYGIDTASFFINIAPLHPSIAIAGPSALCVGDSIQLSGTPVGYRWAMSYPSATVDTAGIVRGISGGTAVIEYINSRCTSDTAFHTVTILPILSATASISAVADTVCAGDMASFTAIAANGGASPSWAWYKNGVATGVVSPGYSTPAMVSGDVVFCKMHTSAACAFPATATSNSKVIYVRGDSVASVSITTDPAHVCEGGSITLAAHPVFGGLAPAYLWRLGVLPLATGSTYSYIPSVGDVVQCRMVSNEHNVCIASDTVYSSIAVPVLASVTPTIAVAAYGNDSLDYLGEIISFFTTVTYEGAAPLYQWFQNGNAVPGATNATFSAEVYANDTVYCMVTSSLECVSPSVAISNVTVIKGDYLAIADPNSNSGNLNVYPQPSTGLVNIVTSATLPEDGIAHLYDVSGRVVMHSLITLGTALQMHLEDVSGVYILTVQSAHHFWTKKVIFAH